MKKLIFLFVIGLIVFIGCKKDNEENFVFSYDGFNLIGFILEVGYYEVVVCFILNEMSVYIG